MAVAQGQLHQMWTTAPETKKNQLKNFSCCLHCLELKLCLGRAGAGGVTFPLFLVFNTLELHWHVHCMVRIPRALIKKHYHLLTSLHQLQQENRLAGCKETSRCSRVPSISPTQHPSSRLQTQHEWFPPRQPKRKASRLWSGDCLLSIRETWSGFSSPALHIYQGKLKETQEGVLLSNNPARF